jgi:hypothetical protein
MFEAYDTNFLKLNMNSQYRPPHCCIFSNFPPSIIPTWKECYLLKMGVTLPAFNG